MIFLPDTKVSGSPFTGGDLTLTKYLQIAVKPEFFRIYNIQDIKFLNCSENREVLRLNAKNAAEIIDRFFKMQIIIITFTITILF